MDKSIFLKDLRMLIANGDTEQAIDNLINLGESLPSFFSEEITLKKSHLRTISRECRQGLLSVEQLNAGEAKINHDLLELLKEIEKAPDVQSIFGSPPVPADKPDISEYAPVDDLIEYGKLSKAMEKFQELTALLNREQKKFVPLQTAYSKLNLREIEESLSSEVVEGHRTQIRRDFTKIVRTLEKEIPRFLQVVDLPVITHLITDQVQLIEVAIKEILEEAYSDICFYTQGRSGWFFRAKKRGTGQDVIIKVFKITSISDLPQRSEMDQILKSRCGNIIRIDKCEFGRLPAYVVLDYIPGITLDKALKTFGGFPLEDALEIMRQLVKALDLVRQKDILHTNIRPSKIFIDEDGSPMISALDIIKFKNDDLRSLTRFKEECQYLSPELLDLTLNTSNRKAVEQSDQFSLGLLLLEMIGGKPLFSSETVSGVFDKRQSFLKTPSRGLHTALQGVKCNTSLQVVLQKMLAEDPNDRYADLSDVLEALNNISKRELSESPLFKSFHVCHNRHHNLTEIFYNRLFIALPDLTPSHFSSLKRQYMMLRFAVYVVFEIEKKEAYFRSILQIEKHKPYLDVAIFNTFLCTLRDTVRDLLGEEWNNEAMLPPWNEKIQKVLDIVECYVPEKATH